MHELESETRNMITMAEVHTYKTCRFSIPERRKLERKRRRCMVKCW